MKTLADELRIGRLNLANTVRERHRQIRGPVGERPVPSFEVGRPFERAFSVKTSNANVSRSAELRTESELRRR